MPNIRNLYLSLPNLTERLCKQKTLYHAFILFFFSKGTLYFKKNVSFKRSLSFKLNSIKNHLEI